jgi:shikimate dehydrogenase
MKPDSILALPATPVPYAVLGQPVTHSLSPAFQQAAFDHCGIEARYYRIEVGEEKLAQAVTHLRQVPFGGWNCTVPDKVLMADLCDRLDDSAARFRAVNTVVNAKGILTGHNTDGLGWSRAVREAFGRELSELRLLLLGAGGAARAIAGQALLEKCPALTIANRSAPRARELADYLRAQFPDAAPRLICLDPADLRAAIAAADLVVNVTSAGLDPTAPPILTAPLLRPGLLVFDTLYGSATKKLRTETETAGARWSDGLGMLLHQGAASFSLWTGREAPLEIMRAALQSAFSASRA